MSNPPLTYDLPNRYIEPVTERQLALLEERRAIAVESPLGSTVKLPFTSSNVHPKSTVDVALLNQSDHPSPNPLRPVNESLLHRLEQSPSNLEIKLLKTLQSGVDKWSQVWTATVEGEGKVYGKVVVKLLVESLYPFPIHFLTEVGLMKKSRFSIGGQQNGSNHEKLERQYSSTLSLDSGIELTCSRSSFSDTPLSGLYKVETF